MKIFQLITILCVSSLGIMSTIANAANPLPAGSFDKECNGDMSRGHYEAKSFFTHKTFKFDYDQSSDKQTIYAKCPKKPGGEEISTQVQRNIEMTHYPTLHRWAVHKTYGCLGLKNNDDGNLTCEN